MKLVLLFPSGGPEDRERMKVIIKQVFEKKPRRKEGVKVQRRAHQKRTDRPWRHKRAQEEGGKLLGLEGEGV